MNIFKNKYFLLGNLAFLLLVIPIALYFIKNQTSTRGSAAPTTTLSFNPPSLTPDQCDQTQKTNLVVNPGQNIVSRVQLALKWDKSKFDIDIAPASSKFQVTKGPDSTPDGMNITIGIGPSGADSVNAISTTTELAIITIKPLAPTNGSVIKLDIDPTGTKVYSLSTQDGAAENVYNAANSSALQLSITPKTCTTGTATDTTPTVTTTTTPSPSVTAAVSLTPSPTTATVTPTAIPTLSANSAPLCLNLSASTSSGSAPLSVTLTATGQDNDGTVSKATFNFGDSTSQEVTSGMGTASVSAQLAHTYNSGGNFTATTTFTDNRGAVSAVCSQVIAVTGAVATLAPTATPTLAPIATSIPTATPTIAATGSVAQTIGLIGGVVIAIIAGIFLLAL